MEPESATMSLLLTCAYWVKPMDIRNARLQQLFEGTRKLSEIMLRFSGCARYSRWRSSKANAYSTPRKPSLRPGDPQPRRRREPEGPPFPHDLDDSDRTGTAESVGRIRRDREVAIELARRYCVGL